MSLFLLVGDGSVNRFRNIAGFASFLIRSDLRGDMIVEGTCSARYEVPGHRVTPSMAELAAIYLSLAQAVAYMRNAEVNSEVHEFLLLSDNINVLEWTLDFDETFLRDMGAPHLVPLCKITHDSLLRLRSLGCTVHLRYPTRGRRSRLIRIYADPAARLARSRGGTQDIPDELLTALIECGEIINSRRGTGQRLILDSF